VIAHGVVTSVMAVGDEPDQTLGAFARAVGEPAPMMPSMRSSAARSFSSAVGSPAAGSSP